jgi:hypothetical protein
MGFIRTPLAAFSDGRDVIGIFGRPEHVPCTRRSPRKPPSCRPEEHLAARRRSASARRRGSASRASATSRRAPAACRARRAARPTRHLRRPDELAERRHAGQHRLHGRGDDRDRAAGSGGPRELPRDRDAADEQVHQLDRARGRALQGQVARQRLLARHGRAPLVGTSRASRSRRRARRSSTC